MARFHETFPFDFVIMLGDNIYGAKSPKSRSQNVSGANPRPLQPGTRPIGLGFGWTVPGEWKYADKYYGYETNRKSREPV